ncbi:RHS repeat-associated core domain-containing protein [Streptomyces sp. NPDC057910]|uniref:RHS repeat-associated core domain-containing protein n=1 Tax=Streptomyces sp. NPDC057910 TaxID=3346278 RepID=UPI0036EADAB5
MVLAATSVPVVTASLASAAEAADGGGVSGEIALGGGAAAEVDERKGTLRSSFPLVSLGGRAGLDASLTMTYDQSLASAGVDLHGLGAGWSVGIPSVRTEGGTVVYPASGGAFETDTASGTGLKRYPLKDLTFTVKKGTLPERAGVDPADRVYEYTLAYDDGRTDYFSGAGDLIARADRFGNETVFLWEKNRAGESLHRPVAVIGTYGQRADLTPTAKGMTVVSPRRSDGTRPEMRLKVDGGRLASVTDPAGQITAFAYTPAPDGAAPGSGELLSKVTTPVGAVTEVSYQAPRGAVAVDTVKTVDKDGKEIAAQRTFRLGVDGERDYTGYPNHHQNGPDGLFDSGDTAYTYTTELSDGVSLVRSTYNNLHLLKKRETFLLADGGKRVALRSQAMDYTGEKDGRAPDPADLPANYAKPARAQITYTGADGKTRTTAETAVFDDHGRQTERTDVTGAKTVMEYGAFGQLVKSVTTGADGTVAVTENTLTPDGRTVAATKDLTGGKGETPKARTVTRFETDGHGELAQKTVVWAEGARPDGDEGPEKGTETYQRTVDAKAGTKTLKVTTPAGTISQVTDLATGQTVAERDLAGRTTLREFDAAGRMVKETAPGGLVTTAVHTPAVTTVTGPDGHITVQKRDMLGRVVEEADNVADDGTKTDRPDARILKKTAYSDNGRTATVTDGPGRVTVVTNDLQGRPVKTVAPNGMTELTAYDDAAHTKTTATLPAGESDLAKARVTSVEKYDDADRQIAASVTYADRTPVPASSRAFDGLGRLKETLSGDVATTPSYGAGGIPESATLTPRSKDFPGPETTAKTRADLTGVPVVKTLDQGAGDRAGTTVKRDAAGRVVEEKDADSKITSTVYNERGEVAKTTGPDGAVTTHTYDDATGRVTETATVSKDGKQSEKRAYSYDQATGRVTGVYDPADKPGTLISYRYSFTGGVTEVAYPDGKKTGQGFDRHGRLTSATDITGATTHYTYNKDGTLKQAVQKTPDGKTTLAEVAYTYDGLGRVVRVERGNKSVTVYGFNDAGQITSDKTTRADGSVITEAAYGYDSHGNLTNRTDTRPETSQDTPATSQGEGADGGRGGKNSGGAAGAEAGGASGGLGREGHSAVKNATTSTAYRYDAYNRLTHSTLKDADGKPLVETVYTLNTSGDVVKTEATRYEGGQTKKTVTEYTMDAGGLLTTVTTDEDEKTQTWDDAGNLLTSHNGTVWTYNTRNQPRTATTPDGTVTAYTYWADGTRKDTTTTSPDGATTRTGFYYTPGGTITNDTHTAAEGSSDGGDPVTASYLSAATREARTLTAGTDSKSSGTAAGAGYLLHDRHGSTTALATTDQSAAVTAAWNYDDYGQHTTTTGTPLPTGAATGTRSSTAAATAAGAAAVNPFTYSGEHTDTRLGTQYLKNRTYDTAQGRFTTRDTAPLHNRYQYADANPVTNTDPTGRTAVLDKIVSGVMIGVTILAAIVTVAITAVTAGWGAALGTALAGAVLDTASAAVETAALATGSNQWDSPLSIAAYTLGAVGSVTGALAPAVGAGIGKTVKRVKGSEIISDTHTNSKTSARNGGSERPTVDPVSAIPERGAEKTGSAATISKSDRPKSNTSTSETIGQQPPPQQTKEITGNVYIGLGGKIERMNVELDFGPGLYASFTDGPAGVGPKTYRPKSLPENLMGHFQIDGDGAIWHVREGERSALSIPISGVTDQARKMGYRAISVGHEGDMMFVALFDDVLIPS